jgi:branched-chain amino acid transport system permease protein
VSVVDMPFAAGAAAVQQQFIVARRWRAWEALPWLAIAALPFVAPGYLPLGATVLVFVLFTLSLDLLLGYAGVVTLGHAAFFGIGAYTAGALPALWGWNEPLSALMLAMLVAGTAGILSGCVLLRYRGLSFLMLTLVISALTFEFANYRADLTGGLDGLIGIEFAPLLGLFPFDFYGRTQYALAAVALLASFLFARHLVQSVLGQSLVGIRENALRMRALGAPVSGRLLMVWSISAALAGLAGGLHAVVGAFVTLDVLSFERSGAVLIALTLMGPGRLYGALLGAALYAVLEDRLAVLDPQYWELGIGCVLIAVALLAPRGLLPAVDALRKESAR